MDEKKRSVYLIVIVGVVLLFYSSIGFEEVNMPFMIIGTALSIYGLILNNRLNKNKRR